MINLQYSSLANKMNKTTKYISIIAVAIIVLGVSTLIWQIKNPASVVIQPTLNPTSTPISSGTSITTLTPAPTPDLTTEWVKYENKVLGFSVSIPKKVSSVDRCNGEEIPVSLKVFEDNVNNVVYFVPEYYYDNVDNPKTGESDCVKKVYSLQLIKDEISGNGLDGKYISSSGNPFLGAGIRVEKVKNDAELSKFIKDNYGSGCFVGSKNHWNQQAGVYDVGINAENGENGGIGTSCPVNYVARILYSPEKEKVMSVKLGQDARFYLNSTNYFYYDNDIVNSFRFE